MFGFKHLSAQLALTESEAEVSCLEVLPHVARVKGDLAAQKAGLGAAVHLHGIVTEIGLELGHIPDEGAFTGWVHPLHPWVSITLISLYPLILAVVLFVVSILLLVWGETVHLLSLLLISH